MMDARVNERKERGEGERLTSALIYDRVVLSFAMCNYDWQFGFDGKGILSIILGSCI